MTSQNYDYQFKTQQILKQLELMDFLSKEELTQLSKLIKKNLEQSSRTMIAVSSNTITAFQLDIGLCFSGTLARFFENADAIYLAKPSRDNTFKADVSKITYKKATIYGSQLDLPPKKSIVQNLIWKHKGVVAVNKNNIRLYKEEFLKLGNKVMANLIDNAIKNNEFI